MRLFLTKILPLLLPVAIYLAWHFHARRKALASGITAPSVRDAPWTWIVAAGLTVMILALVGLGLFTGDEPGGVYVPPYMEDGKIVPGHIER